MCVLINDDDDESLSKARSQTDLASHYIDISRTDGLGPLRLMNYAGVLSLRCLTIRVHMYYAKPILVKRIICTRQFFFLEIRVLQAPKCVFGSKF